MLNAVTTCTNCVNTTGIGAALGVFFAIYAVIAVVGIIATVKIITKAGYSGWWVLIWFVPLLNLVFFLIFAFSDWPVLQRLRAAEQRAVYSGGYGAAGGGYGYVPPSGGPPSGGPPSRQPAGVPEAGPAPLPSFYPSSQPAQPDPVAAPAPAPAPAAPTPETAPTAQPPAGWYPSPDGVGQRWWDGTTWSSQTR